MINIGWVFIHVKHIFLSIFFLIVDVLEAKQIFDKSIEAGAPGVQLDFISITWRIFVHNILEMKVVFVHENTVFFHINFD